MKVMVEIHDSQIIGAMQEAATPASLARPSSRSRSGIAGNARPVRTSRSPLIQRRGVRPSTPRQQIAPNLANQKAPPTARIERLELDTYVFSDDMRPLTPAELDQVVFQGAVLQLRGLGKPVTHTAADCTFTVRDVLDAVEETERRTRDDSEWFDGVVTGASPKGTWARIFRSPVEGKIVDGFGGLLVGDKVRVKLVATDVERGYVDFLRRNRYVVRTASRPGSPLGRVLAP